MVHTCKFRTCIHTYTSIICLGLSTTAVRIDDIPARVIEHSRLLVPAHKALPRFSAEEWGRSGRQAGSRKEICAREDRVGRSTSLGRIDGRWHSLLGEEREIVSDERQ